MRLKKIPSSLVFSQSQHKLKRQFLQAKLLRYKFEAAIGREAVTAVYQMLSENIEEILTKAKRRSSPPQIAEGKALDALGLANAFILRNLPTAFCATPPEPIDFSGKQLWLARIVLTSAGYGIVGEAGQIAVDLEKGEVVGCTLLEEVVKQGKKCYEEKKEEIQTAFLQARKG